MMDPEGNACGLHSAVTEGERIVADVRVATLVTVIYGRFLDRGRGYSARQGSVA